MKQLTISIISALILGIGISHTQESQAAKSSRPTLNKVIVAQLAPGFDPRLAELIVNANGEQSRNIPARVLNKHSVDSMLQVSTTPSAHFISRLYSHLEQSGKNNPATLAKIAKLPSTPLSILRELASNNDEQINTALALNPAINKDIADELLKNKSSNVELALALNKNFSRISPEVAGELIAKFSKKAAITTEISSNEIQDQLAHNNYNSLATGLLQLRGDKNASSNAKQFVANLQAI